MLLKKRYLNHGHTNKKTNLQIQKEIINYLNTFNELVVDIVDIPTFEHFGSTLARVVHLVHYVTFLDELSIFSGTLVARVYQDCMAQQNLPECPKALKKCYALGWIVMILNGSINIADDFYDQSEFRAKQKAWHKLNNRGRKAMHDALVLRHVAGTLLKKHFSNDKDFMKLLTGFSKSQLKLDILFAYERLVKKKLDLGNLETSWKQYNTIVKYKHESLGRAIRLMINQGMKMAGIQNPDVYEQTAEIYRILHYRFTYTDDYMDTFAAGKFEEDTNNNQEKSVDLHSPGFDIESGQLALPILTALDIANEEQKRILLDNYGCGRDKPASADKVREMFTELKVADLILSSEDEEAVKIDEMLKSATSGVPVETLKIVHSLYRVPRDDGGNERQDDSEDDVADKEFEQQVLTMAEFTTLFTHTFGDILMMLKDAGKDDGNCSELKFGSILPWLTRLLCYNVPLGKKARGTCVALVHKVFHPKATKEQTRLSCYAGWVAEILQAAALITDDLQDRSLTRRGRLCWYLKDNIGRKAIKDVQLLGSIASHIITEKFENKSSYHEFKTLIESIILKTCYGQGLDILNDLEKDFTKFTPELYHTIVKYKTAYYTFYLPVVMGLVLADKFTPEKDAQIKPILMEIGCYFQAQDDFLDCYGDEKTIGKIGTDIPDGKCSWLVVSALEIANESQKQIIYENYGKGIDDNRSIQKIKDVYDELGLSEKFANYEDNAVEIIRNQIDLLDEFTESQKKVFHEMVNNTYKRKA